MGRSTRSGRATRVKTLGIMPSTPSGPHTVTARGAASAEIGGRSAQRNGDFAATEEVINMTTEVAGDDAGVVTRKEEIEALPTFGEITGLQPVEAGMTLYLVPLRSGEAKESYFDETANAASIGDKTQKLLEFVDKCVSEALPCAAWSL